VADEPAGLDAAQIVALLDDPNRFQVQCFDSTGSTNDDIRRLAEAGHPEGAVIFAEEQTSGRGRRGRGWEAPKGQGLLFSALLRPGVEPALWPRVTHLAALAICRAASPYLPTRPLIKWPNDVLVHRKKLCGILLESGSHHSEGFLILGIGLNVNQGRSHFSPELQETATSIHLECAKIHSREECAAAVLNAFAALYPGGIEPFDACLKELSEQSALLGKEVTLRQDARELLGVVTGFGPSGELELETPDGRRRLISAGELVRFR
jgi:BirA family biotin operon repressor/biotin-[acetyl-CoA-carboxylase] ligase